MLHLEAGSFKSILHIQTYGLMTELAAAASPESLLPWAVFWPGLWAAKLCQDWSSRGLCVSISVRASCLPMRWISADRRTWMTHTSGTIVLLQVRGALQRLNRLACNVSMLKFSNMWWSSYKEIIIKTTQLPYYLLHHRVQGHVGCPWCPKGAEPCVGQWAIKKRGE